MRSRTAYAQLVACGLIWGSIGVFVKKVDVAASQVVFFRLAMGCAVIVGWFAARRRLAELRIGQHRAALVAVGVILAFHWLLLFESFKRLDVATTILIVYVGPVFIALGAPAFLGERLEPRTVGSLGLSLGGIALIALPDVSGLDAAGLAMAVGAALSFAALVLVLKRLVDLYAPPAIMAWQLGIAALALSPFLVEASARDIARAAPSLLALGIVHTGVAGILWFQALRVVKAQHVGILTYLEPASAVLYAWWLLDEAPAAATLAGGALILLAGLNIVLRSRAPEVPPAALPEPAQGRA